MRLIVIACSMVMVTLAASAQSLPSLPQPPAANIPLPAAPGGVPAKAAGTATNPLTKAETEVKCKIPTNATKPE